MLAVTRVVAFHSGTSEGPNGESLDYVGFPGSTHSACDLSQTELDVWLPSPQAGDCRVEQLHEGLGQRMCLN